MNRAELLRHGAALLSAAGIEDARLDAEVLLAHALGLPRLTMLLDTLRVVSDDAAAAYEGLLIRRSTGEPVAYITGYREFWSLEFAVTPATLIPRPDSETLVDAATRSWSPDVPLRVLDLGTGTGCLLLSVLSEFPESYGVGVDRSAAAAEVAAGNARRLGFADRAAVIVGDWAEAIAGPFDCILANPPYIATDEALSREVVGFEPSTALFAGTEGLDDYRRIVPELPRLLSPQGRAFLEIGYTQAEAVGQLAAASGLAARLHRDIAGRPRCVECFWP